MAAISTNAAQETARRVAALLLATGALLILTAALVHPKVFPEPDQIAGHPGWWVAHLPSMFGGALLATGAFLLSPATRSAPQRVGLGLLAVGGLAMFIGSAVDGALSQPFAAVAVESDSDTYFRAIHLLERQFMMVAFGFNGVGGLVLTLSLARRSAGWARGVFAVGALGFAMVALAAPLLFGLLLPLPFLFAGNLPANAALATWAGAVALGRTVTARASGDAMGA